MTSNNNNNTKHVRNIPYRKKNDDKYLTLHMPKEGPSGYRSIRISTISEIRTRNRVITFKVA